MENAYLCNRNNKHLKKYTIMKTFGEVKEKEYIVRVYGYKAESAKVLKIEKIDKNTLKFTVKGTETGKKYEFKTEMTTTGFGWITGEKYYSEIEMLEGIRIGVELGVTYARKMMMESFQPVYPFFTVNKEKTIDLEMMNRICDKEYEEWMNSEY